MKTKTIKLTADQTKALAEELAALDSSRIAAHCDFIYERAETRALVASMAEDRWTPLTISEAAATKVARVAIALGAKTIISCDLERMAIVIVAAPKKGRAAHACSSCGASTSLRANFGWACVRHYDSLS